MNESFDPSVIYKDVPGWPGYKAGFDGSIWSCHPQGKKLFGWIPTQWHRLKQIRTCAGYLQVSMCINGIRETKNVHNLILITFHGPCPADGMIVRHFPDRTRTNNRADNLRWGTQKANAEDRERDGGNTKGEKNFNAKLTDENVREIRAGQGRGAVMALARQFGVSRTTIHAIRTFKIWRHVL